MMRKKDRARVKKSKKPARAGRQQSRAAQKGRVIHEYEVVYYGRTQGSAEGEEDTIDEALKKAA